MKKKNYSIILCGGLFLASCMSNNDKCLQKLFDEVGVEKSQIHNATHLVTILGNGCKGCIHKALSEIHNSTDTIYIIACKSKKTFNLIANKNIDDYSNVEGGNLAASKIRNLECPNYEICLIDYGCGKFNRKIHIWSNILDLRSRGINIARTARRVFIKCYGYDFKGLSGNC